MSNVEPPIEIGIDVNLDPRDLGEHVAANGKQVAATRQDPGFEGGVNTVVANEIPVHLRSFRKQSIDADRALLADDFVARLSGGFHFRAVADRSTGSVLDEHTIALITPILC